MQNAWIVHVNASCLVDEASERFVAYRHRYCSRKLHERCVAVEAYLFELSAVYSVWKEVKAADETAAFATKSRGS